MKKLCGFVGMTVAGYAGSILAEKLGGGIMSSYIVGTITGGFGLYYGWKFGQRYE